MQWEQLGEEIASLINGFELDFKQAIGYSIRKGNDKLEFVTKAVVYLEKIEQGIKVKTSFPREIQR